MNIEDLSFFLQNQNINFEIIKHEIPIKSRKDALQYFKIEEMVPTLIIRTEKEFFALISSGKRKKVDFNLIRSLLNCSVIEMASEQEVVERLGFEFGGIPLIGHHLPCIVDNQIFKNQFVYGGTGDLYHTLKIAPEDLEKVSNVILKFN